MSGKQGECWRFVRGNAWSIAWDEPQTLGWKSVCGQAYNLKGIKEKISFFLKLYFSFTVAHFHAMMRAYPAMAGGGNF